MAACVIYEAYLHSILEKRHTLWVVNRAFADISFRNFQQQRYGQTVISRMRRNLVIGSREDRALIRSNLNEGVVADEYVTLGKMILDNILTLLKVNIGKEKFTLAQYSPWQGA